MEQSGISRGYHNTTSRYNGYYYAHMKLQADMASMQKNNKDDYTKILPLYIEPGENNINMNADMDSVIKKASLVVQLHTDDKSGKAKSQWIPDCYLMIGQARYFKKDYEPALSTFQYLSSEKKFGAEKKQTSSGYQSSYLSTKEEGKLPYKLPNQSHSPLSFLEHKPARYKAILWLIQTYMTLKKYDEANTIIGAVMHKTDFPNDLRGQLEIYRATIYIDQAQYQDAIQPLKNAIILTKNKKQRTRYYFTLAQLYQKVNDHSNASKQYSYVLTGTPTVEMEFYAKLYSAYAYQGNTSESYYKIIQMLQAMTKNAKYDDYFDQIYYAIAAIYQKEGNNKKAIENYDLAAHKSINNPNQKGLAYAAIGNIYYKQEAYKPSKFAYDSALTSLKPTYDSIISVKNRHSILVDLVKNLNIIQKEDSLQKIASMSDKDREAYINDQQKKIERAKEEAAEEAAQTNNTSNSASQQNNSSSGGGWYFYNVAAKGQGYNQFLQTWGRRTNEDNWRRSNKSSAAPDESDASAAGDTSANDSSKAGKSSDLKKSMLAGLPLTNEKMKVSVERAVKAYYEVADIYNNRIENQPKAIETLNELLIKYPQNSQLLPVWYQLYVLYKDAGNTAQSDRYRDSIALRFPNSDLYKMIKDPSYMATLNKKQNELNTFYASTYNNYLNNDYVAVLERSDEADSMFKPNPLQAKFDLLNAFSVGQVLGKDSMKMRLIKFTKKYPAGDENVLATQVLRNMGYGVKDSLKTKKLNKDSVANIKKSNYKYMANEQQLFIMVFSSIDPKVKIIQDSLYNFITKYHSLDNLSVSTSLLTSTRQMITVKSFNNTTKGMVFFNEILQRQGIINLAAQLNYKMFVIDSKDYLTFYNTRDVDGYTTFFQANYH